jgi:hypothetical protein
MTSRNEGGYYTGKLLGDKPHGFGVVRWDNGNSFEGNFDKGKRKGKGKKINKDGSVFEGDYEDNLPVYGRYKWPDGDEYIGQWKNGTFDGKGTKSKPDGTKYEGEWKDGKPHGQGK